MIAAFLLLLAQDVPAPAAGAQATLPDAAVEGEEIVVRATYGTTTMLFDKGADNKLRNCRIMVSSGSQRRDANACQATPVCYEKTADEVTDCVELGLIAPDSLGKPKPQPVADGTSIFTLPKFVKPKPAPVPGMLGPVDPLVDTEANDRQRVKKLPRPPQEPPASGGPTIRMTNAQDK